MRQEHIIERQGKKMVLYGGLLDEAHQQGLKSIDTEPIQLPTDANNHVSITKATVELEDGRKFSGIGDASPQNVGKMIKDHIIRMSETRAKSRALRDAVNVGELIVDESEIDAGEAREQIASLRGGGQGSTTPGGATWKSARMAAERMYRNSDQFENVEAAKQWMKHQPQEKVDELTIAFAGDGG